MAAPKGNKYASFNNAAAIGTKKRDWIKRDLNSFTGKRTIALYNHFRMQNESEIITKQQYEELGELFRPNADLGLAINKVKSFLNKEEVKSLADSDLRQKLSHYGVDLDYIVAKKKEILDNSIKEKQLSTALKTVESFQEDLGHKNRVKISETRKITENSSLNENYQKAMSEKRQITVNKESNSGQIDESNTPGMAKE